MRWHRQGGASLPVEAYGSEAWWTELAGPPPPSRCHDCGVGLGELHVAGCDMERCPHDGSQAIQCECERTEPVAFTDLLTTLYELPTTNGASASFRVQYFGKNGQWVWTRRRTDFDTALRIARRWAAEKHRETRVWASNAQDGESLICYVSPDGIVVDRPPTLW